MKKLFLAFMCAFVFMAIASPSPASADIGRDILNLLREPPPPPLPPPPPPSYHAAPRPSPYQQWLTPSPKYSRNDLIRVRIFDDDMLFERGERQMLGSITMDTEARTGLVTRLYVVGLNPASEYDILQLLRFGGVTGSDAVVCVSISPYGREATVQVATIRYGAFRTKMMVIPRDDLQGQLERILHNPFGLFH